MHNLGDTYEETHDGVAPDLEASTRRYLTTAELGYETAFYDAGYAVAYGRVVQKTKTLVVGGSASYGRSGTGRGKEADLSRCTC